MFFFNQGSAEGGEVVRPSDADHMVNYFQGDPSLAGAGTSKLEGSRCSGIFQN